MKTTSSSDTYGETELTSTLTGVLLFSSDEFLSHCPANLATIADYRLTDSREASIAPPVKSVIRLLKLHGVDTM